MLQSEKSDIFAVNKDEETYDSKETWWKVLRLGKSRFNSDHI